MVSPNWAFLGLVCVIIGSVFVTVEGGGGFDDDMGDIGGGDYSNDDSGWAVDPGDSGGWSAEGGNELEEPGIGEVGGAMHQCLERKKHGPCNKNKRRWYFDDAKGDCQSFKYGGCKGNSNNFKTKKDCRKVCVDFLNLPPCICVASSHYLTFDGLKIDHQGRCKYTVTRTKNRKSNCAFDVQVKKYPLKGSGRLTYARLVDLKFKGHIIRMGPKDALKIDGVDRDIPVTSIPGLKIACFGKWLEARGEMCGFSILFDMESTVKISLDRVTWGGKVFGMCGNCDEVKLNDWNVREGYNVGHRRKKIALVGDSYLVPDNSDKPEEHCDYKFYDPKCPKHVHRMIKTKYYCGKILDRNGPFKECIRSGAVDHKTYYRMCGYDVCAAAKGHKYPKGAICRALGNFADACAAANHISHRWRSRNFCMHRCKRNMWFNPLASGCPNTCMNKKASRNCNKPATEACVCREGYYLDGPNRCVKADKCGCVDEDGDYYRQGHEWLGPGCKSLRKCIRKNGRFRIVAKSISCDDAAHCAVRRGKRVCVCNWPYKGNGIMCRRECPPFSCRKKCKYGFRKACGCLVCACNKCPPVKCEKHCLFGYYRDSKGCKTCSCNRLCPRPQCYKRCTRGRLWKRNKKNRCWYCVCKGLEL